MESSRIAQQRAYIERRYSNKIWFTSRYPVVDPIEDACWCRSCRYGHYSRNILSIYKVHNFILREGDVITEELQTSIQEIYNEKCHRAVNIPSLQSLAGTTTTINVLSGRLNINTLPVCMQNAINMKEYKNATQNYVRHFKMRYITLPTIAKHHLGQFVITSQPHPNKVQDRIFNKIAEYDRKITRCAERQK